MWICLRNSFLSITDEGDPARTSLLVSAGHQDDILAIFPDADVREDSSGACWARIDRRVVAEVIADQIESIRYPDLVAAIQAQARNGIHPEAWQAMAKLRVLGRRV